MQDTPRIFDDDGKLIAIDATKLPAPMAERYAAVVAAYQTNEQAQRELDAANAEVTAALSAVRNTTQLYDSNWPRETFHDLWKQNFGGGPANAKRARGL